MAKKDKQLYHCSFVLSEEHEPYSDFYYVYAYSPCHAWQIMCEHLIKFEGVPISSIQKDTIKVDFKIPNFLNNYGYSKTS